MSTKMGTSGFLKITVFWKKGYDVIIPVDDVTKNILSHYSNYTVDVFMWPKFGNSRVNLVISMREVITTYFITIWPEKPLFWGVALVQVQ